MPALTVGSRVLIATVLVGSMLWGATPALADKIVGGGAETPTEETPGEGGTISATAGDVDFDESKNGKGNSVGPVTSTISWTPPACWYAPTYTPEELQAELEPRWEAGSTGYEWDAKQRDRFVNGNPYKDFNRDKSGEGYFWGSYVNKSYPPGWDACTEDYFWVDTGDDPPANIENTIDPEILAHLAYERIRVPGTEVTLAPEGTTKVNLPTWAWLDAAEFQPVSVTASVPVLGIQATTTAVPVSLRIDPGTKDAETYPASGECALQGDRIGEPYARGKSDQTPPCGVKYLRSSGDGSYPLAATVTWEISWTGTGVAQPQPLPAGEFGAEQDVVVEEIQAVNR
ncbi:hypothetical protein [Streptomyces sp. NPDC002845]